MRVPQSKHVQCLSKYVSCPKNLIPHCPQPSARAHRRSHRRAGTAFARARSSGAPDEPDDVLGPSQGASGQTTRTVQTHVRESTACALVLARGQLTIAMRGERSRLVDTAKIDTIRREGLSALCNEERAPATYVATTLRRPRASMTSQCKRPAPPSQCMPCAVAAT